MHKELHKRLMETIIASELDVDVVLSVLTLIIQELQEDEKEMRRRMLRLVG